jgi:hypothetical protein
VRITFDPLLPGEFAFKLQVCRANTPDAPSAARPERLATKFGLTSP